VIRAADLFCGAGGSSTGLLQAVEAVGGRVDLTAVNHWDVAIETHAANHPAARHLCESLDGVDPRKVIPGKKLDILTASPECIHHSNARGGKPMDDQSRATAWHVLRWAEALRPTWVLVENVREFTSWGPLGATGRPLKAKRGVLFAQFVATLQALGYRVEWRVLNAADYGAATTRQRFFLVARLGSGPIPWPDRTHAPASAAASLFGALPTWRAAREVIDWSLRGRSIFEGKPLAEKTLARIAAGAHRFWGVDLEPFLVVMRQNADARSLDQPLPTITAKGTHLGLVEPFMLQQQSGGAPRRVSAPVPTVATKGAISLIEPFLIKYFATATGAQSIADPLDTVTTKDRHALVSGEVDQVALDVRIRMLQPHELAAGQGFPAGYIFAGTKTEQTRQIGNAVEVHQARALFASMLSARRAVA
jgi:DNA (cytosine-5)-methyltransferase 1